MDRSDDRRTATYDNDTEFIKALRRGTVLIACRVCGQVHLKIERT
jgi:hypothetical protein